MHDPKQELGLICFYHYYNCLYLSQDERYCHFKLEHLPRMEETSIGFGFVLHDLIALMHAKLFHLYSSKKKT